MKQINKTEWKEIQDSGFKTKFPVKKTSHGRYYFLVEIDYNNYLLFKKNRQKKG